VSFSGCDIAGVTGLESGAGLIVDCGLGNGELVLLPADGMVGRFGSVVGLLACPGVVLRRLLSEKPLPGFLSGWAVFGFCDCWRCILAQSRQMLPSCISLLQILQFAKPGLLIEIYVIQIDTNQNNHVNE
jgi:hypothetical protein